jgi:PhoPQ-activated pathogenicity-related protein
MKSKIFRILPALTLALVSFATSALATPLDDYVAKPDPAFKYELNEAASTTSATHDTKVYHLVSQEWLTSKEVDRTLWEHWVTVVVPKERKFKPAMLVISGGGNGGEAPEANGALVQIALRTQSIVMEVKQIPNQPLNFTEEKMEQYKDGRKEDALITYGWDKFLKGGRAEWLARLPMTKAVVRAMDLVQAEIPDVESFFVMGASKRGWTTWTTAAVDKRVMGIAPAVIDVLNFVPSVENHFNAYGFFAPAVSEYVEMEIMSRVRTPEMKALLEIVEPYSYRDRLTMPKYILNSAGDQFFTPDSWKFYFNDLVGEKHLRYMPNTDHGLSIEAYMNAASFYNALLAGTPRPEYSWKIEADGALEMTCKTAPEKVLLWQAHNPKARDFRLEEIGAAWTSTPLEGKDGVYRALPEIKEGYTAFMIEATFKNSGFPMPFVFTTGVSILPDTYPGKK